MAAMMSLREKRMTTQEAKHRIAKYIENRRKRCEGQKPIFEIVLFEHPDKELIFVKDGKEIPSGYPDAAMDNMGFYYELDTAIEAMHGNWLDIQETVFHAGFILCHFPGLYESAHSDGRIYFLWDEGRQGFFEADEPEIFRHVTY